MMGKYADDYGTLIYGIYDEPVSWQDLSLGPMSFHSLPEGGVFDLMINSGPWHLNQVERGMLWLGHYVEPRPELRVVSSPPFGYSFPDYNQFPQLFTFGEWQQAGTPQITQSIRLVWGCYWRYETLSRRDMFAPLYATGELTKGMSILPILAPLLLFGTAMITAALPPSRRRRKQQLSN